MGGYIRYPYLLAPLSRSGLSCGPDRIVADTAMLSLSLPPQT